MARDAYLPKRESPRGDLDFFPTPPDATRSFLCAYKEITGSCLIDGRRVWEPACGAGHMAEVVWEFSPFSVVATDIEDRGYGVVSNFLDPDDAIAREILSEPVDLIITNPPFDSTADDFIERACSLPVRHVALLTRFQFLEGCRRFERFWRRGGPCRPWFVFLYVTRVQMVAGRLPNAGDGGSSIAFSWMVFDKEADATAPVLFDWVDNRGDTRQLPVF